MEPKIAIETRGLSFQYENGLALSDITFRAAESELVALVGPNGSGKTTLLKILLGLLRPGAGTVALYNQPLSSYAPKERAKNIAYVSQQPALSFPLTVSELVALGRYPHSLRFQSSSQDATAVDHALNQTDAMHLAHRNFDTLSGGEQQKVLIARALAQSARILLLDEPTLHLDLYYQLQILAALKRLCTEQRITVITVLHDVNLVSLFADKALLLSSGQLRAFGPVEVVINEAAIKDLLGVAMKATKDGETGARYFVPRDPFKTQQRPS
jgi:iron complex transport system ATP-binding protein